jgi:cell division protein FtsN
LEIEEDVFSELNDKENDEIFYSLTSEFPVETEIETSSDDLLSFPEAEISLLQESEGIQDEEPINIKAVTEEVSISFEEPLSIEDIIEDGLTAEPDFTTDFKKDFTIPELVDTSFTEEDVKEDLLSELSLIEQPSEVPSEIPKPVPEEIPEIPEEIPQTPESPEPQPENDNLLSSVPEAYSLIEDNLDEDLNFEGMIEEIKPDTDEKVFRFETDLPDEQPQEFNLSDLSAADIEDNITETAEATFGELAEKIPDNKVDNTLSSFQKSDVDDVEAPGKEYQRVKSLTREFFNLSEVEQNDNMLSWDFGESEQLEKDIRKLTRAFDEIDPEHGKENKDGFTPVKSRKATYEWSPGTLPEIEPDYKSEFEDSDTIDFSMDEDIFKSEEPEAKQPAEPAYQQKKNKKESVIEQKKIKKDYARAEKKIKSEEKREQKKSYSFIITVGVLAVITIAVLIYYNFNIFKSAPEVKTKVTPTVIERNDQVPVMMQEPNQTIPDQQTPANNVSAGVEINKPVETVTQTAEIVRVSDGLYKRGAAYFLQISSWKTKSKAEQESSRLIEKGYKSEILTSTLNSVLVYRVLVGEFNSPEEAKNFNNNF